MSTDATWHPTEDDLVLLFYGDTSPDEERRLAAHLETCAECQPQWDDIKASLAVVDAAGVPEPPADFERVMWARVQREIDGIRPARTAWWAPQYWLPAGSLALVVLAVMVGLQWSNTVDTTNVAGTTDANAASQPERALLVAMDDHLERSELLLVELMNADPSSPDAVRLGYEREAADDLLASSRLYRQTATYTGNVELASMLEDLERVLVEIARAPQDMKPQDLNALRTRIEEDDLLFKVRVVNDEVRKRQQTLIADRSEGDQ